MTTPSPKQVQWKIAGVQGWTNLGAEPNIVGTVPSGDYAADVPDWPTDRNASYDLLHKMNAEDTRNATVAAQKHYRFILATHPANEESLIYLWHEGYRWVECTRKRHEGNSPDTMVACPDCHGEGGEFVHDG